MCFQLYSLPSRTCTQLQVRLLFLVCLRLLVPAVHVLLQVFDGVLGLQLARLPHPGWLQNIPLCWRRQY